MWKLSEMAATPAVQGYVPISEFSEVSPETRRARGRSGFGRTNTNANRKNGGGATWSGVKVEALAGAQIVSPPTQARIKTRDDSGISLPNEHMTATRKRHERDGSGPKSGKIRKTGKYADAPFTRFESEDAHIRDRTRDQHARRDLTDYR